MSEARRARRTTLTYRPHLDGLRAVAVYLVVLYHAGVGALDGGYVGVDVFFVLSGYLVTSLLLEEHHQDGSVRVGRFYARRYRRLLPAAFATLVVTATLFRTVASPVDVAGAVGGFKASFLYVANWFFIHQSADYFGADIHSNPVLHFWSLAVEEQFYLVWPVILGAALVVVRRRPSGMQVLTAFIAAAALGSAALAWHLRVTDPNHAYYGTDTRAYELLAGALLALAPALFARLANRRLVARAAPIALVGLLVVASGMTHLDAIERGLLVTAIAVALVTALECAGPTDWTKRLLSGNGITYLGRISYGTYLWHWPVIVVVGHLLDVSSGSMAAVAIVLASALGSASHQLLEQPIRMSHLLDRHRRLVIATGLTVSVLGAVVVIPAVTAHPATASAAPTGTAQGFTPTPHLDWAAIGADFPPTHDCDGQPVERCTIVSGTGPHVLLVGDSHAQMLIPTFSAIARTEGYTLSVDVRPACPWQRHLRVRPQFDPGLCAAHQTDLYERVLPALHPDVIIAMDLAYENNDEVFHFANDDGSALRSSSDVRKVVDDATRGALDQLLAHTSKVVLVESAPFTSFDPLSCLSAAPVIEQCRYVVPTQPTLSETIYRELAASHRGHVWSLDMDHLICPFFPICDPIVNGQVVAVNFNHLTAAFAATLAPPVDAYLHQNAIVPSSRK